MCFPPLDSNLQMNKPTVVSGITCPGGSAQVPPSRLLNCWATSVLVGKQLLCQTHGVPSPGPRCSPDLAVTFYNRISLYLLWTKGKPPKEWASLGFWTVVFYPWLTDLKKLGFFPNELSFIKPNIINTGMGGREGSEDQRGLQHAFMFTRVIRKLLQGTFLYMHGTCLKEYTQYR